MSGIKKKGAEPWSNRLGLNSLAPQILIELLLVKSILSTSGIQKMNKTLPDFKTIYSTKC
jgi:hypothetical protein